MGASGGGEKGKEVSGDTGAGLRAGNELGTTITLPLLQAHRAAAQSREQRGNDRLGWRGGEKSCPSLGGGRSTKKQAGLGSQDTCVQFQIKSRNVSECLLHTKHSREPMLSLVLLVSKRPPR